MYLEYGVSDSGELVYVEQVARGATALKCPYCGGLLVAKKGEIKAHHFAHAGETCRQVERDEDTVALPCYDNFNLHLPGKVLQDLLAFYTNESGYDRARLERYELIAFNEWARNRRGEYELTKKGKIPVGELSLQLFNEFQEPLLIQKHDEMESRARETHKRPKTLVAEIDRLKGQIDHLDSGGYSGMRGLRDDMIYRAKQQIADYTRKIQTTDVDLQTALTDLRLYRAQLRRILSCSLYCLEIDGGKLYKIGVTTRDIAERVDEIRADLMPHLGSAKIDVVDTWPGRGNVELYFKHRYRQHNHPLGALTEYFKFDDAKPMIRDLRRMKPKEFADVERNILAGEPSDLERAIHLEAVETRRRAAIRVGMKKAVNRGRHIGRPEGNESPEAFLTKPKIVEVRQALEQGMSLREAARAADVSVNTVRKVKMLTERQD